MVKFKNISILLISLLSWTSIYANQNSICQLIIDKNRVERILKSAKPMFTGVKFSDKPTMMFPLFNGTEVEFTFEKSSMLGPEMQAKYPDIKSYFLQSVKNPTCQAIVNLTPDGLFAIFNENGVISKISKASQNRADNEYIGSKINATEYYCEKIEEIDHSHFQSFQKNDQNNSCFENGSFLRTFRIAIAVTYEYANFYGATLSSVNAQILNDLAGLNLIYQSQLAIKFELCSSNDVLTNAVLNYSGPDDDYFTDPLDTYSSVVESGDFINDLLSVTDYDLGHSFHSTSGGGGGRASVGVVCSLESSNNTKGRGYTILAQNNESYLILAHEVGHQFACTHTSYACDTHECQGYEPGNGISIMSSPCGSNNSYGPRQNIFTMGSLQSIIEFVETGSLTFPSTNCSPSSSTNGMCALQTPTGNTVPSANANPNNGNYTIPKSTPFILIGDGHDPDGDYLSYSWDQYDTDYGGNIQMDDAGNSGTLTDPLFRMFLPTTSQERVCPQLSSILNGNITSMTGEDMPEETRTMKWRFSVRDNFLGANAIACDETSIAVDATKGPFQITSHNTETIWMADGTNTATITWDVAGTTDAPISCTHVDIVFSTDKGESFPITLSTNSPNDGSEIIIIPSTTTNIGRIRVICSDNIFFDINNADITVNTTCIASGGLITPTDNITAVEGTTALDLNLGVNHGNDLSIFSETLETTDPTMNVPGYYSVTGNCSTIFGNTSYFDSVSLSVDVSGEYTFSLREDINTFFIDLYDGPFNPTSSCTNIIDLDNESTSISGALYQGDVTVNLIAGVPYVLVAHGFNTPSNQPSIPADFTIDISGPGNILAIGDIPQPGFSYTYMIVDNITNTIIGFEPNSDFSNDNTYPGSAEGTSYLVYGLSYQTNADVSTYIDADMSALSTDLSQLDICGSLSFNNIEITITSNCFANGGMISPTDQVTAFEGSIDLNLNLATNNTPVPGFSNTYMIVDVITNTIIGFEPSSDFSNATDYPGSIDGFHYLVFGLSYENNLDLLAYIGTNASTLYSNIASSDICASLSTNNIEITILSNCSSGGVLISPDNNIIATEGSPDLNLSLTTSDAPALGFSYTYMIINEMNNIIGFEENSDFSDASTYTGSINGSDYVVYGLSYESTSDLIPYIGMNFSILSSDIALMVFCGEISLNNIEVTIIVNCGANGGSIVTDTNIIAHEGSTDLDFDLRVNFGNTLDNLSGILEPLDSIMTLPHGFTPAGSCATVLGNTFYYDSFPVIANVSGEYTFSLVEDLSLSHLYISLYEAPFNHNDPCNNLVDIDPDLSQFSGRVNWYDITIPLSDGIMYEIVIHGYRLANEFYPTNSPEFPANYLIDITGPGNLISISTGSTPEFAYTYIIVNENTNTIISFEEDVDFSNSSEYPGTMHGMSYLVYGLSYESSVNLLPYIGADFSTFETDISQSVFCADISVNNKKTTIVSNCGANGGLITPANNIISQEGSASLQLNLDVIHGSDSNMLLDTLDTSDPIMDVPGIWALTGNCESTLFGGTSYFDSYTVKVDVSGDYIFSMPLYVQTLRISLYTGSFDPNFVCDNIIDLEDDPNQISGLFVRGDVTISLTAGTEYIMVFHGYNTLTNQPLIPAKYVITVTGPGTIISLGDEPAPEFSYTYILVNESTNTIVGIESNADFSDVASYPGSIDGTHYIVYGLSYESTTDLSPYIGTDFNTLQSDIAQFNFCADFSLNSVGLTITSTCAENYAGINSLSGDESGTHTYYESNGLIESTQRVLSGANVAYNSQAEVLFNIGFECEINAGLHAYIEGCQND